MRYLLDTDHISFLQRGSGAEFSNLSNRLSQHSPADYVLSIVSFHEQTLGAHTFINRAQIRTDILRGYNLLMQTLQGYSKMIVLPFDAPAIALFEQFQAQKSSRLNHGFENFSNCTFKRFNRTHSKYTRFQSSSRIICRRLGQFEESAIAL